MQHLNSNQINCCSLVLTQVLQEQSMTPINRASLTLILEQFKPYFPSIGELFKIENPTERMKVMSEDWHEVNIAPIPATLFENWVLNAFSTYWLTELTKQHTEKVLPEEQKVIEPEVTIESEPADIREPITPTEQ